MTLDEVIKHCEEIAMDKTNLAQILWDSKEKARCEDCAEEHNQLAQWLIELKMLKTEQEPKTVLYSGDGYADGYMVYDMAECPSCGYEYEDGDKDWGLSFCPNCGQKLNWESEDEDDT